MRGVRILAAALAVDLATDYRFDLLGRACGPAEKTTVAAPEAAMPADVYRPVGRVPRKAMLLVHGLAAAGKDDERLGRLASSFARAGALVIVPDIEDFRQERMRPRNLQSAADALRTAIAIAGPDLPLSAGGFSYAAGPLFVAAARPEFEGRIHELVAFGGFFDMRNVLVFALTGRFEHLGSRYRIEPSPFVRKLACSYILERFEEGVVREKLEALWRETDREAILIAAEDPALPIRGRHFARILIEEDPVVVLDLVRKIDNGILMDLWKVSPASVIPGIPGRVLLIHSTGDSLIPFTESQRLRQALAGRGPVDLALLRAWSHVDRGKKQPSSRDRTPREAARDEPGGMSASAPARGGGALTIYRVLREVMKAPRSAPVTRKRLSA